MIRIIKPPIVPEKLREEGKIETEKNKQLYEQFEEEFKAGKKKFTFDSDIYGHENIKKILIEAQHHKCCFCERKEEIGDVEHFRPKSAYQQREGDTLSNVGYYWLAYEWDNLFLACPKCNRSYKRNLFPLADESKRATSHLADVTAETPLFIHPQKDDPEEYIEYIRDKPRAINGNERGRITIEKTGLDRPFLDNRRFEKYQTYKTIYHSMNAIQELLETEEFDLQKKQEWETIILRSQKRLEEAQKDEAEFASMIRCAVKHDFRF